MAHSEKEAIYQSVAGQAFGEIVVKQLEGPSEKPGRGSIHHLAIRVKNEEELALLGRSRERTWLPVIRYC